MEHGFLRRVWLLHMVGVITRMKYYGVWTLTEGACILAGIGYKGVDPVTGKASWDRLQNVKPLGVELAQNTHAYLGNWNINTNNWLRNYVYLRVTPKGKKPGFRASMATFVTSAFWHGFYPGYYLTFVLASFHQYIAKSKVLTSAQPILANLHTRCPPPLPPVLHATTACQCCPTRPRCQTPRTEAHTIQDLLRCCMLVHYPSRLFLHRRTLHPAGLLCQRKSLGARLLLLHHWRCCLHRLSVLPRESSSRQAAEETARHDEAGHGKTGERKGGYHAGIAG